MSILRDKKILLIEDDTTFQHKLKEFFESKGFAFFVASDGESGTRLAEELIPDIILLDLILPQKDGFAVLENIKSNPRLDKTPVVILSNLEGGRDIERANSLGAALYLVKANYSLNDIMDKIEEILDES